MRKLIGLVVLALVAVGAFWAGRITLEPPETVTQVAEASVVVDVVEQQLGRVLTLTTTVQRASTPLAVNRLAGVVTAVGPGGEVNTGDTLYAVGGRPVRVIPGTVPFHRDLAHGTSGDDVRQLQEYLVASGVAEFEATGTWGNATSRAVRAWQKASGQPQNGTILLGELVAAPALPVQVRLNTEALWLGADLAGGEKLVSVSTGEPTLFMELTTSQEKLVPPGTTVKVKNGDLTWEGVTGDATPSDLGAKLPVTAVDGSLLCGEECSQLPPTPETNLLTDVLIVPPETGPVVPIAALTTQPDGTTSVLVVTSSGEATTPVTVRTVADGLAVVDGVSVGDKVRVFGKSNIPSPTAEPTGE